MMEKKNNKQPYDWNMYHGAKSITRTRAKNLRASLTEAEDKLWQCIRNRKTGYKFRRQHPMGIYIADFYCNEVKLVVEVDGGIHKTKKQKEWDEDRTFNIQLMDTEVIRFTNEEVLNETGRVLMEITSKCKELKIKQSKK